MLGLAVAWRGQHERHAVTRAMPRPIPCGDKSAAGGRVRVRVLAAANLRGGLRVRGRVFLPQQTCAAGLGLRARAFVQTYAAGLGLKG